MPEDTEFLNRARDETKSWVFDFVIGHNLCPFARKPFESDQIRFVCSDAHEDSDLLQALAQEFELLLSDSAIETTLIIVPNALGTFTAYWDFIEVAGALIETLGLEGVFQIATFHPQYQFEGTEPGAPENRTNRSPYPLLHILREESLSQAIETHPDVAQIPERNIALMYQLFR
jgi:hypothetical protein